MTFGSRSKLLYSTAHIMTTFEVDGTDLLIIYGDIGQTVELAIAVGSFASVETQGGLSIKSHVTVVCFLVSLLVLTSEVTSEHLSGSSDHQFRNHIGHSYSPIDRFRCNL